MSTGWTDCQTSTSGWRRSERDRRRVSLFKNTKQDHPPLAQKNHNLSETDTNAARRTDLIQIDMGSEILPVDRYGAGFPAASLRTSPTQRTAGPVLLRAGRRWRPPGSRADGPRSASDQGWKDDRPRSCPRRTESPLVERCLSAASDRDVVGRGSAPLRSKVVISRARADQRGALQSRIRSRGDRILLQVFDLIAFSATNRRPFRRKIL